MRALRNPCDIFSYFETCFSCRDLPGFGFCPGEMPEEAVAEVLEDVLEEPRHVDGGSRGTVGRVVEGDGEGSEAVLGEELDLVEETQQKLLFYN